MDSPGPERRPQDRKSTRLNSSHTEIYTLSLHDALPISPDGRISSGSGPRGVGIACNSGVGNHGFPWPGTKTAPARIATPPFGGAYQHPHDRASNLSAFYTLISYYGIQSPNPMTTREESGESRF